MIAILAFGCGMFFGVFMMVAVRVAGIEDRLSWVNGSIARRLNGGKQFI